MQDVRALRCEGIAFKKEKNVRNTKYVTYPVGSLVGDINNEGGGDLELEPSE